MPSNMHRRHHGLVKRLSSLLVIVVLSTWLAPLASANRWGANYFPNVTLYTQDGVPVRFYEDLLKGRSVAVNTMYTGCSRECPLETARLLQVQRLLGERMGRDIHFISISIDPMNDTPEALKKYTETFKVGPGWTFVTGKPEDIQLVVKKLGLVRGSDVNNKDGHAPSLMIGNEPTGQWMRNSALDNAQFLADTMKNFLGWRDGTRPASRSYAQAKPLAIDMRKYLFENRCGACHSIGGGDTVGPDLAGVIKRRGAHWVARYLADPARLRAAGDPVARDLVARYPSVRMPNPGLLKLELEAVLAYLEQPEPPGMASVRR